MIQDLVHKKIVASRQRVDDWFREASRGLFFPFYSSFDIRDSSFKVAPVDANIFPAGFNNICPTDQESSVELVEAYFRDHYPDHFKNIVLLTEEHTQNPYYWENVRTLERLLTEAGKTVRLAMPKTMAPLKIQSASGHELTVYGAERFDGGVRAGDIVADLIVSNNDFSIAYQDWMTGLNTPINPPHQLGWHQRRKDEFFREYNELARQFCEILGIDPWHLSVKTTLVDQFDIQSEESRFALADRVDEVLADLKKSYGQGQVAHEPFVFIKNNAGTYGLGVTQAASGDEVRNWSYKARKKMKAAKGGREIEQVIIQEGIPTTVTADGATAEPAIYMIGCQLAGGFLRAHKEKSPLESLNSPGAVYRRLCVSDLKVSVEGHPMENVYGWVARLGFLAIAREAKAHHIVCPCFR